MKISKDSWHFKMLKGMNLITTYDVDHGLVDSCQYRRRMIGGILLNTFFVLFLTLLVFGFWLPISFGILYLDPEFGFTLATMFLLLVWFINAVGLCYLTREYEYKLPDWLTYKLFDIKDVVESRKYSNLKYEKEPNIFVQHYRNLKDKVCTKVEFNDGD